MKLDDKHTKQCINYIQGLIEKKYTSERLSEAKRVVENKSLFDVEYGRGGTELYRGAHCRSMIIDLFISNLKRGRIIKRFVKNPDYIFYYDKGIITLVSKNPGKKDEIFEHIKWNDHIESSITITADGQMPKWPEICEATVDDNKRLKKNISLTAITNSSKKLVNFNLYIEEYFYSNVLTSANLFIITSAGLDNVYLTRAVFDFIYDSDGKAKEYVLHTSDDDDTIDSISLPSHIKSMICQKLI